MCDAQTQEGCSRPREPAPRASLRRKLSTASNYPLVWLLVIKPCDDGGRPLVRSSPQFLYPDGLIRLLHENQGRVPATARASYFQPIPRPGLIRGLRFRATPTCFPRVPGLLRGWGKSRRRGSLRGNQRDAAGTADTKNAQEPRPLATRLIKRPAWQIARAPSSKA